MGFLSTSAAKAYKKGARRAHIPEWFEPAAYVFAAVVGVFLIVSYVLDDGPVAGNPTGPVDQIVITGSAGTPDTSGSGTDGSVPATVDVQTSSDAETVPLVDGGDVVVPSGAWTAAKAATFGLLTGDFNAVTLYPGKTPPILLTTWDEPSILGLVSFERNPDETVSFVVRVDPDGTGNETPRDVPFVLAKIETAWAYLPG